MNILFLVDTANPIKGGIQRVSYCLYKYFKSRNHKVLVVSWGQKDDVLTDDYFCMPDSDEGDSVDNRKFLNKIIDDYGIQLIMNHTALSPQNSPLLRFCKQKGVYIVTVYHSSPFGVYGIRKYAKLSNINNGFFRRLIDRIIRICFYIKYGKLLKMQAEYSDKIVMLSDKFISEYLYFVGDKFQKKMLAIPNPLTVERIGCKDKENILLFVGRLAPEKGLPYLMEIWNKIEPKYPDWSMQIVGDGAGRSYIENKINKLGLKRCFLLGFQNPETFYNKAKVFCMTSLYEGFGLVLIEAMSYGVVPLAFNSYSNVSDIIEDSQNGFLIPPFDVDAYVEKISLLLSDSNKLSKMANEAYEKSKKYTIGLIGQQWEKLFASLLFK